MTKRRGSIAAIAAATLALGESATAQSYPDRIIEMVVPSTPGSSADILGRILGDSMGSQLGQRFIVLNKAGASSILGTAEVGRAKPDGYTLIHTAVFAITVQPLTERQTGYTAQSFEPICQTFKNDQVIVARPNTYKNVADLLAASKAKPGGLNYGTPGVGTTPHIVGEQFGNSLGVKLVQINYNGEAPITKDGAAKFSDFGRRF
jgi:tripartite-type tricarboxylate transporter receptor subunit TctC